MKRRSNLGTTLAALIAMAVVTAAAGDAFAQAQDPGQNRRRTGASYQQGMRGGLGEWWNNPETIEKLGLDEATREQIDDEVYRAQQEMIDLKAEVERQNLELGRLLKSPDDLDVKDAEAQVDKVVGAHAARMKGEMMLRVNVAALLTPDQRIEVQQLWRQRAPRGRQRPGRPPRDDGPEPGDEPDKP
jgi:Spy/CpxP family protein refolding chaperone